MSLLLPFLPTKIKFGPWAPWTLQDSAGKTQSFLYRRWAAVVSFKLTLAVPRQKLSKSLSFRKNHVRHRMYFLAVRDGITSHAQLCHTNRKLLTFHRFQWKQIRWLIPSLIPGLSQIHGKLIQEWPWRGRTFPSVSGA